MANLRHTYTSPLLRNFEIQDLKSFLPEYIDDFTKKLTNQTGDNGWYKISEVLNEFIQNDENADNEIDKILFEKLFFNLQDHVHLFHLESDINADEFVSRFQDRSVFLSKLSTLTQSEDKLISLRRDGNKIFLLYKYDTITLGSTGQRSNFYIPCMLDFENSLFQIRLRKHYITSSPYKHNDLLTNIKSYVNELDGDISIHSYNETHIYNLIYSIFKEESENAEKIIKQSMNDDLTEEIVDQKIIDFLADQLAMSNPEGYSDRVKSAFYQDLSVHMDPSTFHDGFISAFTFLDKNFIKSSTRSPRRDPIYNSKVYWNLKDLIHEYEEVSELACFWKFNEANFDAHPEGNEFEFVEVALRERNGSIEIQYYQSPNEKRRLKEEYVYYRIKRHLL
ncbi:hypothetical protein M3221_13780 [Domibacillus indicus]|uniref:hypothetical protein n=1 Tax=Domibacillus indicus TaxID=1437523 RepID=UPI00203B4976|nr:hypothetical protein [Domibacillus indicus]MCM3789471.1 hypothetical protein [Domibacillus indicus]